MADRPSDDGCAYLVRIHSSEVSTIDSRSLLLMTSSGVADPVPIGLDCNTKDLSFSRSSSPPLTSPRPSSDPSPQSITPLGLNHRYHFTTKIIADLSSQLTLRNDFPGTGFFVLAASAGTALLQGTIRRWLRLPLPPDEEACRPQPERLEVARRNIPRPQNESKRARDNGGAGSPREGFYFCSQRKTLIRPLAKGGLT
jgi:hypothetical protein